MSFVYKSDSALSKDSSTSRNDFMDLNVKGTSLDYAGGSRPLPLEDHVNEWNQDELEAEFKSSGIAHKIVSKPAQDATRNGFRLIIPEEPELQDKYQNELEKLNLQKRFEEELEYRALYGDGFLSIGTTVEQGTENIYDPIDVNNLATVEYVHAFGHTSRIKDVQLGTNPLKNDYLKEIKLLVDPPKKAAKVSKNGEVSGEETEENTLVIDSTRYFRTSLDKLEGDKWGTSVLNRCRDAIQTMDTALFANIKLARNFNLKVYKSRKLAQTSDPKIRRQYHDELAMGLTTSSIIAIDNDEDFSNVSTNVNGIDSIYTFAWQNLASACGIPKSILTGEQSGTLAGASQDVINYYDGIRAIQEEVLKPQLIYLTRLLMYSTKIADGVIDPDSIKWSIEFPPLWSADDKTQSETFLNISKSIQTLISCGAIGPTEASDILKAQSNNGNISAIQGEQDSAIEPTLSKKDIKEYTDMLDEIEGTDNEQKKAK